MRWHTRGDNCTRAAALLTLLLTVAAIGCSGDDGSTDDGGTGLVWEVAQEELPGALLSVWGTSPNDLWAVGSRTGEGPLVLHYDGAGWQRLDASAAGNVDLWWVFGFAGGPVYMGGSGGAILAYQDGEFSPMQTPDSSPTVFGIWGCSPGDVWAVGGQEGGSRGGFAWRLDGQTWTAADGFPTQASLTDAVWKIVGRSCSDVWMVGTAGLAIHWDGESFGGVERVAGNSLFTVHADSERFVAVGGFGTGVVIENDGSGWVDASPAGSDPLVGVCLADGSAYASGWYGSILRREDGEWVSEDTGLELDETFHSIWIDSAGGVWAAGGQVLVRPLNRGVLIHGSRGS